MKIESRNVGRYQYASLIHDGMTIDLGTIDENARDELAKSLISSVFGIGPSSFDECVEWMCRMADDEGIHIRPFEPSP